MYEKTTISIGEAADFLGFKGTQHLREKAKKGLIPGAFKISNRWMFLKEELVNLAKNYYKNLKEANGHATEKHNAWHSAKQKIAPTGTHGFLSVESECKNLREQLRGQKRKNMKSSEDEK